MKSFPDGILAVFKMKQSVIADGTDNNREGKDLCGFDADERVIVGDAERLCRLAAVVVVGNFFLRNDIFFSGSIRFPSARSGIFINRSHHLRLLTSIQSDSVRLSPIRSDLQSDSVISITAAGRSTAGAIIIGLLSVYAWHMPSIPCIFVCMERPVHRPLRPDHSSDARLYNVYKIV